MTLEGSDNEPLKVLLAEDNPADVELTQRILRNSEHPVNLTVVEDGEVAMAMIRQEGEHGDTPRPDLILLDLNMPKKTGYEVLAEMNADVNLRMIPVLILTSTQVERDHLYFDNVGPSRYCNKPLPIDRFNSLARQLRSEDYVAWSALGRLEDEERESRMLEKYSELAGLTEVQRGIQITAMVRAEFDMLDEKLRAMAVSRLQVQLRMEESAAEAIATSYRAAIQQLPIANAMRRSEMVRQLRTVFTEEEQERLVAVDPGAFGATPASPPPSQAASQPAVQQSSRRRRWWPFGR